MSDKFRVIATIALLIVGVSVIIGTFVLIVKDRKRAHVIQDEISALQEEKKKYEHENMELQDKIAYLKSEHSYEKEAKKLNYKKQGEHVVVVRRSHDKLLSEKEGIEDIEEEHTEKHYEIWSKYFFE